VRDFAARVELSWRLQLRLIQRLDLRFRSRSASSVSFFATGSSTIDGKPMECFAAAAIISPIRIKCVPDAGGVP
jgi:hypothetical protein